MVAKIRFGEDFVVKINAGVVNDLALLLCRDPDLLETAIKFHLLLAKTLEIIGVESEERES